MLNAWKCEVCGEEILPGEYYVELPDGTTLCCDIACVAKYAEKHWIRTNPTEEELRLIAEEEQYEQEREARQ